MGKEGPSEVVHMIGKDILRFHAVYWPAFLMAANDALPAGERLPLPKTVFAHGWIYYEQDKMSKSKGNVVYPEPIVDALDSFGAPGNDALRYYLLREAPFGHDTSFSYDALIQRYNSDLANDLGNLASRTLTLLQTRFGGKVPAPSGSRAKGEVEAQAVATSVALGGEVDKRLDQCNFSGALDLNSRDVANANRYFTEAHPWANDDRDQVADVLGHAATTLRKVAVVACPIMPAATTRLWTQLGETGSLAAIRRDQRQMWETFPEGAAVSKPEPIFPRLDKAKTLARLNELADIDRERDKPKGASIAVPEQEQPAASSQPSASGHQQPATGNPSPAAPPAGAQEPATGKITIDDFTRVELVVGQILSAEPIPKAQKLLKLQVDIGSETRQVCAGIAGFYKPEDLVGMKIVLVANLEPRKLRGVESNGMVVAASAGPEGKPVLATFKEDVPNGTRLK